MIDDTVPFHSVNLMSRWRKENGFGSAFKSPRDNVIPTSFNYFPDKLNWKCQIISFYQKKKNFFSIKSFICLLYLQCYNL